MFHPIGLTAVPAEARQLAIAAAAISQGQWAFLSGTNSAENEPEVTPVASYAHAQKARALLAPIIKEVEALHQRLESDSKLGKGSVTISDVRSTAPSLCAVADSCAIHLDRRLTEGETLETALQELVDGVWGRFVVDPARITVPFLTMAGENELGHEGIRQAREFHRRNRSAEKDVRITTALEGAGAHCQLDNFPLARQTVFDWIEDRMRAA